MGDLEPDPQKGQNQEQEQNPSTRRKRESPGEAEGCVGEDVLIFSEGISFPGSKLSTTTATTPAANTYRYGTLRSFMRLSFALSSAASSTTTRYPRSTIWSCVCLGAWCALWPVYAQLDLFEKESIGPVNSLAMASSTATQFGHAAVAQSIDKLQYQVFEIYVSPYAEHVSAQRFNELQTELAAVKAQMKSVGGPLTESFRCEADYNSCMGSALTWGRKVTCTLSFIAASFSSSRHWSLEEGAKTGVAGKKSEGGQDTRPHLRHGDGGRGMSEAEYLRQQKKAFYDDAKGAGKDERRATEISEKMDELVRGLVQTIQVGGGGCGGRA